MQLVVLAVARFLPTPGFKHLSEFFCQLLQVKLFTTVNSPSTFLTVAIALFSLYSRISIILFLNVFLSVGVFGI